MPGPKEDLSSRSQALKLDELGLWDPMLAPYSHSPNETLNKA